MEETVSCHFLACYVSPLLSRKRLGGKVKVKNWTQMFSSQCIIVFVAVHYDNIFVIKTHNEIEDFCKLLFFPIHRTALNVRLDYLSGYVLSQGTKKNQIDLLDVFKCMKTPKQPSGAFIHYQGHFFITFIWGFTTFHWWPLDEVRTPSP